MKAPALWVFSTLFFFTSISGAATFVGNGGNVGDVELKVTLKQMQETLQSIIDEDEVDLPLCICHPELEGHGSCETLKSLTPAQVKTCSRLLREKAPDLQNLLSSEGGLRIRWTTQEIDVEEDRGARRADAVADQASKQITLNQSRFLSMKSYERILLVGHELFHLVKVDGTTLRDDRPFGPYESPEGGRMLLNSLGAGLTMRAMSVGSIGKYQTPLLRSQGHKKTWISVGLQNVSTGYSDEIFKVDHESGPKLELRYDGGDWGVYGTFRSAQGKQSFLSVIDVDENQSAWGAGATYKFFPGSDPLSFWGQSYLLAKVGVEWLSTQYHIQDGVTDVRTSATSTSLTAGGAYFMPLRQNFWIYLQVGYSGHHYRYDLNELASVEYTRPQTSYEWGVSYGF